jgi:hypothetical protein
MPEVPPTVPILGTSKTLIKDVTKAPLMVGLVSKVLAGVSVGVTPLKSASANPVESLAIHPVEPTCDQLSNHPCKNVKVYTKEGEKI